MSVLALKAIGYGAEQIPDSFFEKIPGGFFTPKEKKDIKKKRKDRKDRKEREHRAESRRSRRDRSSSADDSASSGYEDTDTGDERGEQKNRERSRRAKSNRRRFSRSPSRGRHNQRSLDLDGEAPDHIDMAANIEQGQGPGPYFPPPPQSGNRPYSPQEYSQGPARDDYYHPSSTQPTYDYLPQVNNFSRSRSATVPTMSAASTPVASCPPTWMNWTPSNPSSPLRLPSSVFDSLSRGTPLSAVFSPSYEPPLAALLQRPATNSPQPAAAQTYSGHIPAVPSPTVAYGAEAAHRYEEIQNANSMPRQQPRSSSTARYTPGPGYSPSPAAMPESSIPPPPIGSSPNYTPYNPADYAPGNTNYQASGNPYASPPPFYRQRSNSQPSLAPGYNQPYSFYTPPAPSQQMTQYNQPPSRRDSSTKRHSDRGRRARSADSHSQPRSSRRSHHYEDSRRSRHEEDSRMADLRGRFDSMDLRRKSLAATVGGALAGGFAGRAMGGRSRLTTIVGAAAGALGGRSLADKREE